MQRRVEEAYGDGSALHRLVNAFKVLSLHGQQFCKRFSALLLRFGHNHFAHGHDSVAVEEHMLRAAETYAFRTETHGVGCVFGSVGVGSYLHDAVLVCPTHDCAEIAGHGRLH